MGKKKSKEPKIRTSWGFNPKSRVVPNKKKEMEKKRSKVDWKKEID